MEWLMENWGALVAILGAVLSLATMITALTPTPKDDAVVAKVRDFVGRLGIARYSDSSKPLPKLPGTSPRDY